MKHFKDDNSLKLKVIDTVDGSKEYLKNCVKIGNLYYRKDDQAVFIDNKWWVRNSSSLYYDWYLQKLVVKKKGVNIKTGIVSCNEDGSFIYGDYSPNSFANCEVWYVRNGNKVKENCMDYKLVKSLGYIEHINENIWASEEYFGKDMFDEEALKVFSPSVADILKRNFNSSKETFENPKKYKFENNAYNAEDSSDFSKAIKQYSEFEIDLTKDVKRAAKLIGDASFG